VGTKAHWEAYADDTFSENLGADFLHDDTVSPEGWARYYFVGKFATDVAYLKLQLENSQTGLLIKTFYFQFTKNYQTSLSGRYYITDPITGEKLVKNGVLVELICNKETGIFEPGHITFPQLRLAPVNTDDGDSSEGIQKITAQSRAIIQTMVRYSEAPKAVFLVTPPHLMKYAKLLLILIKQLVDLNFDKSYMTKSNQKPLYKTRFMLDELGNLQSEGHGISGFETMLSIGLGQEQQFTIILQTLQQLRDVYGESVDKIVQGNTSNIIFLKSTDDAMIDTLQKMSGTRHVVYRDSKTVTKDVEKILRIGSVEGRVSYTMAAREEPVISYNDMAFISERNSILFRAGDSPVWNRNETILPMSWRLFKDTLIHPGNDYSLQSIPTLSSVADYDVRRNQPDFFNMLETRILQAVYAEDAKRKYQEAFDYTDIDISRLDPDVYSDSIMEVINESIANDYMETVFMDMGDEGTAWYDNNISSYEENLQIQQEISSAEARQKERQLKRYAGGLLSREDLGPALDNEIIGAYLECSRAMHADYNNFSTGEKGSLVSSDGKTSYIIRVSSDSAQQIEEYENTARVHQEPGAISEVANWGQGSYQVTPEFYQFLGSLASWQELVNGRFDSEVARLYRRKEDESLR